MTWRADDFAAHVRRLRDIEGSALAKRLGTDWSAHAENTARLYDLSAWRSELEWADRTIDPEEARRRAAQAKRDGRKPPEHPIIPPVAVRPEQLAKRRLDAYLSEISAHVGSSTPVPTRSDRSAFDRHWGVADS